MIIVVDTNIVFSAILNVNNNINKIFRFKDFEFVSINFLKTEIIKHKSKIQKITGFDDLTYYNIYFSIITKIKFIDEILITNENYLEAFELTKDIDSDDILFVALTNQLDVFC